MRLDRAFFGSCNASTIVHGNRLFNAWAEVKYREVGTFGNRERPLFLSPFLGEILIQPMTEPARVGPYDAVDSRIVAWPAAKDRGADVLLVNLFELAAPGQIADTTQKT